MVGQASSLSIGDDGQDARPAGNLSGVQRKRLLRPAGGGTRNDNLLPRQVNGYVGLDHAVFIPGSIMATAVAISSVTSAISWCVALCQSRN